jgi:hypothetical protein
MKKQFLFITLLATFCATAWVLDASGPEFEGGEYFIHGLFWALDAWYIKTFHSSNVKTKVILAGLTSLIGFSASLIFLAGYDVPTAWVAWRKISGFLLIAIQVSDIGGGGGGGNYIDDELEKIVGGEKEVTEPITYG